MPLIPERLVQQGRDWLGFILGRGPDPTRANRTSAPWVPGVAVVDHEGEQSGIAANPLSAQLRDALGASVGTAANPLRVADVGTAGADSPLVTKDVWGRDLAVAPFQLLSTLWSYGDVAKRGRVTEGGTGTVTSVDGSLQLLVAADDDVAVYRSRRHPAYQADRGHVFSTATQGIDLEDNARLRMGLFGPDCGVFFEMVGTSVFAVRRNVVGVTPPAPEDWTTGSGTVTDERVDITAALVAAGVSDLTVNRLYDIRFQWRGAGDVQFFIDQQLVYTFERLGSAAGLSIAVPSQPVRLELEATGALVASQAVRFGCVSVSSEGGSEPGTQSVVVQREASEAGITTEKVWLAVKPAPWVHGLAHARDVQPVRFQLIVDNVTVVRVYRGKEADLTISAWEAAPQTDGVLVDAAPTAAALENFQLVAVGLTSDADFFGTSPNLDLGNLDVLSPDEGGTLATPDDGDVLLVTLEANSGTGNDIWSALTLAIEV